jgi:hypothetical protein
MSEQSSKAQQTVLERFKWKTVEAPKFWNPKEGETLTGFYGGMTVKQAKWGEYSAAMIHVPVDGCFMVTGTQIINLLDANSVPMGHPVNIQFKGRIETGNGRQMKVFELQVADGMALGAEDLPQVQN